MLKVGQIEETVITGYTSEGEGVCRIDGCAVFVPNAVRSERCLVKLTYLGKNSAHGKIDRILEKSPHRVNRSCPYAKRCGGCQFWHIDYAEECELKAHRVGEALNRIGGLQLESLQILGADGVQRMVQLASDANSDKTNPPEPALPQGVCAYRNKAQYPIQMQKRRVVAGFYQARTHDVVPMDRCLIQDPAADQIKEIVLQWANQYRVSAYDDRTKQGLLRHLYVRKGFATGQIMVCLVANGDRLPQEQALVSQLRSHVKGLETVLLCENKTPGNVVLSDNYRTLYGSGSIEDTLLGLRFRLSPRSFYQVNHDQAERLYERAISAAGLTGKETLLDLYCGTGTITLAMARHAKRAIGVEIIPQAIADARENAVRNGVTNAEFFCADAGEAAKKLAAEGTRPDVICVDPPRKGLSQEVVAAIAEMAPERVVYVSCDPATLARDIRRFADYAYNPLAAEAVDMFPRTAHVETVVQLVRKNPDMTVDVTLNLEDADLTAAESKATYDQIKAYVLNTFGLRVTSLQIAQTKRKLGLPTGEHYNLSQKENQVIPNCPPEKGSAIREALRHFRMI